MRLDSGQVVTIPEVVRTACHSTLVKIYLSFCEEAGFVPLSRSTLFHILSKCPASQRTNLKGLDNVAADGGMAFQNLLSTLSDMLKFTVDPQKCTEIQECRDNLTASKIYMKTDYRVHLQQESPCPDHCINFALSDPTDQLLQEQCNHRHDMGCDRCSLLPQAVTDMKKLLSELAELSKETKTEMLSDIDSSEAKILEWKSHIVRAVNQDKARTCRLENLSSGEALIILDWAMKFLPIAYREKQSDWFGQKGVNWHVAVCIYKDEEMNLKHRTYAHTMDCTKQDSHAVAAMLEHILLTIHEQLPVIQHIFLRSDNAGCYHCGSLWHTLPEISRRTGLLIVRYDFSEAQDGKSYCDAKIAHMRGRMRQAAAEGHSILSASDMKSALDANGGISACQAACVEVSEPASVPSTYAIKGISKLSNIQFDKDGRLRCWKAYGVGEGKVLQDKEITPPKAEVSVLLNFIVPSNTDGKIKEPRISKEEQLSCPEPECSRTFDTFSDLQNHALLGHHDIQLQTCSTFDNIRLRWRDSCLNLSEGTRSYATDSSSTYARSESSSSMGWALKKDKKSARFSDKVKAYLRNLFEVGERTGKKANPSTVMQNMKVYRDEQGRKRFQPHEYLEVSQITSYFSRLSVLKRKPVQKVSIDDHDLNSILVEINKAEAVEKICHL